MKWESVELGEVCEILSGSTPSRTKPNYWNGDIPWVTPKDLSGLSSKYLNSVPEYITDEGYKSCSTKMLPPKSLVFSSRAPIGHLAITKFSLCTNQGFKSMVPSDKVNVDYLYYCIKANTEKIKQLGRGATFKEVSKSNLAKFKIPLPPLPEQRRLAARLDKADALRQKSRAVVETYAELGRSVFLEVFGDPVKNEKGWEVVEIGKISEVVTGNTPPRSIEEYYGDYIEWVKTDNINTPHMYLTEAKEFLSSKGAAKGRIASKNSILVTCIAGSPQVIGNAAIANRDVAFNQQINAMTEIRGNTAFFYYQLLVSKQLIQSFSTNSMKGMISKSKFKKIPLINPPLDLQARFARMVANIEAQRRLAERQLAAAEAVFGGVLQGTFEM